MGAVTDVVKRVLPGSYRAMVGETNSYFAPTELQGIADFVKFRLFGTVLDPSLEATTYDPLLTDFLGKVTTLQFIPAAVDFWGDQLMTETTTGTNETVSYPDRRTGLWKIFDELRAEVQADYFQLAEIYGFKIYGSKSMIPQVSYGDGKRGILITPDPMMTRPPFRHHRRNNGLNWMRVTP